ncbi:nucleotidyltransferase domain-containing protein [Bordetella sp. N]|uniref:nucleotidyltransferase domain-containing protein n=1 Tax=Bordetella sp. N TaxID=1746199 RepID=UPI00070A7CF5|nr:nucleotidyltransferase domain-containing protein [Bordetella sp. N]ALM86556.1 hypothetical protein ASB57_29730 [Bordetella sp. N]
MSDKKDVLTALFPSALRRKALALLFSRPHEAFHVRELIRLLDVSPGALPRELLDMAEAGILRRDRRGNQVLYGVNREAPFFPELYGLIQKIAGDIPALRLALQPYAGEIDFACVFGSVARNEAGPNSDIDLLLVGDGITGRMKAELRVAMNDAGRALDIQDFTRAEYAELLHQGSPFIGEVLNNPLIMLVGEEDGLKSPGSIRGGGQS